MESRVAASSRPSTSYRQPCSAFPSRHPRCWSARLPRSNHRFCSRKSFHVAAVAKAKTEDENPEDEYELPGGDPEIMKEVCDKLFPPNEMDWEAFWKTDDFEEWHPKFVEAFQEAGGYDPSDPSRDPSTVEQMEWMTRATDYLRTREDFSEFLPVSWGNQVNQGMKVDPEDEELDILGDEDDRPWNRDMSVWDLRAVMEKRRYREKSRATWRRKQANLGTGPSLDVLKDDVRISDDDRAMFELTEEEAWHFITQGGQAADPKEVLKHVSIMDPEEKIDFPALGVRYIEEVDEFLKRKGHWTTKEADLTSKSITLEGDDFIDFQQMVGEIPEIDDRKRVDSEWSGDMNDA
ncbi:hypothetical protein BSKO_10390 [Bryopsis sp. KO-2023]|nr:hypothetical protein BSKO_10390 [Bryopsis sp. KO-2023]